MSEEETKGTLGKSPEALFLDALISELEKVSARDIGALAIGYIAGSIKSYVSRTEHEVACRKGCNHCCKYMVAVSSAEVISIFHYLQQTRNPEQLTKFKKRIEERVNLVSGMKEKEYWDTTHQEGCLFLNKEGGCTIYPTRPRACASLIVTDAEPCKTHAGQVTQHVVPKNMGIIGFIALSKELKRRKLQSGIYEFNSALLTMFNDPNATEKWLSGENIFQGNMNPELDNRIHLEVFNG